MRIEQELMATRLIQRRTSRWAIAFGVLILAVAASLLGGRAEFHPYVTVQAPESLEVQFLHGAQPAKSQCEAVVAAIVKTLQEQCGDCRLLEQRCIEALDPRQRKILSGLPVDVPVMRVPGGAVAFLSKKPEVAYEACWGAGQHAARSVSAECAKAGPDGIALSMARIGGAPDAAQTPGPGTLSIIIALASVISLLGCLLILRSSHLHGRFSHDMSATGPQKFHTDPTPRIGGVSIAAALAASMLALEALDWLDPASAYGLAMLALSAIPAFAGGLAEDLTRRIGVMARLLLTFASAVFASLLVGATLDRLDMPGLDAALQWPVFAVAFTAFAVGGVANSINIIDGYNGLAAGYSVVVLAALAWVAGQVGDPVVLTASLVMAGALLGFLAWNYPGGKIFMGDGGAYLLGFWLAELAVLLVVRNPEVSPWFPLMLLAYPIVDTLFSIYRRWLLRGESAGSADAMHLHQLIYSRLARAAAGSTLPEELRRRNNQVVLGVCGSTAPFIVAALLLWRDTAWLVALGIAFWVAYVWLYLRLARWRVPAWLLGASGRTD
jgi:UDP-N-acetylmuramyl pentapeptide phosphotransferase/UDP-N-acetylglucosamine-1-phosphate transferase